MGRPCGQLAKTARSSPPAPTRCAGREPLAGGALRAAYGVTPANAMFVSGNAYGVARQKPGIGSGIGPVGGRKTTRRGIGKAVIRARGRWSAGEGHGHGRASRRRAGQGKPERAASGPVTVGGEPPTPPSSATNPGASRGEGRTPELSGRTPRGVWGNGSPRWPTGPCRGSCPQGRTTIAKQLWSESTSRFTDGGCCSMLRAWDSPFSGCKS